MCFGFQLAAGPRRISGPKDQLQLGFWITGGRLEERMHRLSAMIDERK